MLVEFIIPTYNRKEPLKVMLSSLLAQTDPNWGALVYQDGMDNTISKDIVDWIGDSRIRHKQTEKRMNDWGHTPRELGKNESEADYIVMTGDDNYYTPNFVMELRRAIKMNITPPGIIYWDMVHSHAGYQYFPCTPKINLIDMGAFATRNDLAKKTKLGKEFAADGYFIENIWKNHSREKFFKIKKVLFVHN